MANRLVMTQQLHEAISTVLAQGLCVDIEAGEGGEGYQVTTLNIGFLHSREARATRALAVQFTQAPASEWGYFMEAVPGLCRGEHRTIAPFLDAITRHPDQFLREALYEAVPSDAPSSASDAWQLMLA